MLLDVAATENGRAHVITDGLAGAEQQMMPLLGFLAKSRREAEFPTEILMRLGHSTVGSLSDRFGAMQVQLAFCIM